MVTEKVRNSYDWSLSMKHQICFRDVETGWYNALPLGNGKFGAMVYFRDRELHIALNQYDCYYHVKGAGFVDPARKERTFEEIRSVVDRERQKPEYDRSHYTRTLNPPSGKRPVYGGGSYPQGGEVVISFSDRVDTERSMLKLVIEEAKVFFFAGTKDCYVEAELWVAADCDGVGIGLKESEKSLWESVRLWRQDGRGQEKYTYTDRVEPGKCVMHCSFRPEGAEADTEPFVQETAVVFSQTPLSENRMEYEESFFIAASVQPGQGCAVETAEALRKNRKIAEHAHKELWQKFWKCSVKLPDFYLETLWHLYVYLLGCCSGSGSIYTEQACGLSGLWDIRRPCMWGSMWYWDVNIQTAFYGTFASNHLEQAKVFCDGFLSYREETHSFAKRVYGKDGWATDYPHTLYHCIQPWCALFLWKYYAYSKDQDFLSDKAYPAFCEILAFYQENSRVDENGIRHLDYDICPEQGPVAADTVITTAALKQLTKYAMHAAEILKRPEKEIQNLKELLCSYPEYAVTEDGSRWKDSEAVQSNIYLRHPSVLMPIFPAEEVHVKSEKMWKSLAEQTIQYAAEHTEPGTFGFEWVAAAAARMGAGESALRILYEKGLDYVTHSNGLGYEESERFINYCHLTKPANYLPAMCEEAGGVTAVINLLLLQELDGIIHLFPALPDGKDHYCRRKTQYVQDEDCLSATYGPWRDCGFVNMLAPGGFEISAQMRDGRVNWICVNCNADGVLRLAVPAGSEGILGNSLIYESEMHSGETVEFGYAVEMDSEEIKTEETFVSEIQVHQAAHTHRRTFLGENADTAYYKAVDSMICPYGYADVLYYPMTPYVFDFTEDMNKNYDEVYLPQILEVGQSVLLAGGPRTVGNESYQGNRGYGFLSLDDGGACGVTLKKRVGPDTLRNDFAEGIGEAVFGVELPAGKYTLLLIAGDEEEESYTAFSIEECGIRLPGERKAAGRYQYRVIPILHEKDGILKIGIHSEWELKWKLNALFINKEYLLL